MATYRALIGISEAILALLRMRYDPADFANDLDFAIYTVENFRSPMNAGVSIFLYRILHNGTYRAPAGRIGNNGERFRTDVPVDCLYLLCAWGRQASLQQAVAGWLLRVMEDHPILPSGLLNAVTPGIFAADEAVELTPGDLPTEDMLRFWEILDTHRLPILLPYVARAVRIESELQLSTAELVQERLFNLGIEAE